jgi:hypothetical protein
MRAFCIGLREPPKLRILAVEGVPNQDRDPDRSARSATPRSPQPEESKMKKLVLNVDDLKVQSFETVKAPRDRGTVLGAQENTYDASCASCESVCYCFTQGEDTCNYSCDFTCDWSCYGTCGCDTDAGMWTCDWRCYDQTRWYSPC